MKKIVAGVFAGVGAVSMVASAMAGAASAEPRYWSDYAAQNCIGLSPNVIDNPYNGGVRVDMSSEQLGAPTVLWGNPSFWGYHTDGQLTWKNLRTGKHGSLKTHFDHGIDGGGFSAKVETGSGPVRFTTSAVNRGPLLTLGAPRCTGTVKVW